MKSNVIQSIAYAVADYYNMEVSMMFENTRRRDLTDKRAIFHFLCHKHTELSLQEIGRYSEVYGRAPYNHATVIHNIKKSKNLVTVDKRFAIDLLHLDAYVTKNIIIKKEKDVLINQNIQLMLERWFEYENRDYLDCLSSIAEIMHTESNLDNIKKWIDSYEGFHKAT
jgi:hypothetical protein|tara:strand:+ start:2691 stop:3194 length:504 start_codon:yes stop_codon:yes gene_type:complete